MDRYTVQEEMNKAVITEEVMDAVKAGLSATMETLCDPGISRMSMERLDIIKSCFLLIRKAMYIQADLANHANEYGYYNTNDFMTSVCGNLHSYLSGIFDIEIRYEENASESLNLNFNARLLEKAIYDVAYNMIIYSDSRAWAKNSTRRITFFTKDGGKYVNFCARSNFPSQPPKQNLAEIGMLYPSVAVLIEGESYADIAAKQMGGGASRKHLKNMTRAEISVPKIIGISERKMKECETVIRLGEPVMVYEPSSTGVLSDFFAGLGLM